MKKKCKEEKDDKGKIQSYPAYICKVCGERSENIKDLCHPRKLYY